MTNPKSTPEKTKKPFPHIFVVLIAMMAIALIATWIVPSGKYARVLDPGSNRQVVDPTSFSYTEKSYLTPFDFLTSITDGLVGAALVGFSIMIIGGSWQVINATGAIPVGISAIGKKVKGKEAFVFPILMFVFAFIAAVIGGGELQIVYLPAIMPLILALGYDTMSAAACVIVSAVSAFAVSVTNPFTVGIGHQIAGLRLYSGAGFRIVLQVVFFIVAVVYVVRYANKVRKNPTESLCYEESEAFKKGFDFEEYNSIKPEKKHTVIAFVLVGLLFLMVFGVVKWGWYMNEINGLFIIAAVTSAVISRLNLNESCEAFSAGAKSVVVAAIVCGLSRGIMTVLEAGVIIDVIIHALANMISALPQSISVIGIFIAQSLFNFLVNSGSGQFLITMPILSPLGDLVGISQQTLILASQMGDGFTNMLFPTSGTLMALLAYSKIPFPKWVKFIMPYILIATAIGCVVLVAAQLSGYGISYGL